MEARDLLLEVFDRLPGLVREAVRTLSAEQLRQPPGPGANTVGWLVWHLTRVQDSHVAEVLDAEQVWLTSDWADAFGRTADPADTGFGHSAAEVAALAPRDADALVGYHEAVAARTRDFLAGLTPADLDRVVDENWDPPVTLGVRLASVADDDLQHVGQAAYARGLIERS
ncbi:DinB family protein [Plantactinospora sp. GCM10030261]|uniref:mycothiol transferase n=1 Tax=Plantactinospora sp. GCM10030261 TaxID=3273420 RepID=UPI00361E66C6